MTKFHRGDSMKCAIGAKSQKYLKEEIYWCCKVKELLYETEQYQ